MNRQDIEAEALRIVTTTHLLPKVRKTLKAGYALGMLWPTAAASAAAKMCGRTARPLPHFVKDEDEGDGWDGTRRGRLKCAP